MMVKKAFKKNNILLRNTDKLAKNARDVLSARLCTFVNPYSYWRLRTESWLLDDFDVIAVDGASLCSFLRGTGIRDVERLSFDMTSIAGQVFEKAESAGETIFLVGAGPSEIEKAVETIKKRYGKLKICGYHHGYFDSEAEWKLFDRIFEISADIVICGMGAINQERFLSRLVRSGWAGQGYSCGGFIHQIAKGGLDYYPGWIDRWNLRWLFRLTDEPKLVRRYFLQYPVAFLTLLKDAMLFRLIYATKGK
jgi:N-acetylglucosaminyldiphosphoundecaprenol N-acetyl-beta-D-mannosaminyltransferase